MRLSGCLLVAVVLFSPNLSGQSLPAVSPFTVLIEEDAGIARDNEPVQVSLPFAPGVLFQPNVELRAGAQVLPAQRSVLARWSDGSIRWLLTRFFVDVPARGRLQVTVVPSVSPIPQAPALAHEEKSRISIDTGTIGVSLGSDQRDGFLVSNRAGALLKRRPTLVVYSGDGQIHRAEAPDVVELEENGALYASVFVAGSMRSEQGASIFRYETRLHFWRGKSLVQAEHTVVNVSGPAVTEVDGIVVDFAANEPFSKVQFAREEARQVTSGDRLRLLQNCAYWHETLPGVPPQYLVLEKDFTYVLADQQGEVSRGQQSAGAMRADGRRHSIGIFVRDFWEEGPKALEVSADGSVKVELYAHWQPRPGEARPPVPPYFEPVGTVGYWEQNLGEFQEWVQNGASPYYFRHPRAKEWLDLMEQRQYAAAVKRFIEVTGYEGPRRRGPLRFGRTRAKTTDVFYVFGTAQKPDLSALVSLRSQLIPVVDSDYLAGTRAMPWIWKSARRSGVPDFEKVLVAAFRNYEQRAQTYGFLHFGDGQTNFGYNGNFPSSSDVLEYDTIRSLVTQFARTGIRDYVRRASQSARHYADVDQNQLDGTVRFHGYYWTADFHEEAKATDMGGHIYAQGLVDHYVLTGDRRSLRSALRIGQALLGSYGSQNPENVTRTDDRSLTRPAIALLAIYDLTRDPAHLAAVRRMMTVWNDLTGDVFIRRLGKAPFRTWYHYPGDFPEHVLELFARYHSITGDADTLRALRQGADYLLDHFWDSEREAWFGLTNTPFADALQMFGRRGPDTAMWGFGFAYLATVTGELDYLRPFLDDIDRLGQGWEDRVGNRQFTQAHLWSIPFISILPDDWPSRKDEVVLRERIRAELTEDSRLDASTTAGRLQPTVHGQVGWVDAPFGRVLHTGNGGWVTYAAPAGILRYPGTLTFWVRQGDGAPLPKVYGLTPQTRSLIHIASDQPLTNSLDVLIHGTQLWARIYDSRGWQSVTVEAPSPWGQPEPQDASARIYSPSVDRTGLGSSREWHHVAVVWNRFNIVIYIDGEEVARREHTRLPEGGQTSVHIGWRPGNFYGQADFWKLRVFGSALPSHRIRRLWEEERLARDRTGR